MKNQIKITEFLNKNKNRQFSINQIAKELRINYRTAYEDVLKLQKQGIISINKLGNSNQCLINNVLNDIVFKVENLKKNKLLKNKNFKVLYSRLNDIKNPFFICVVFGSYAKSTANEKSDLDICLITDLEEINEQFNAIVNITPLNIHMLRFTSKEFISMLRTKEFNVGHEIIKQNIILKGIELFYELMKYA